jgi:type III secretory pathway component EscR
MTDLVGTDTLLIAGFGLALAPLLLAATTCFAKISILIGILRSGFGVQGVPGKMAEFALSFALTGFIMSPVLKECTQALRESDQPLYSGGSEVNWEVAKVAIDPWLKFMDRQVGEKERAFIQSLGTTTVEESDSSDLLESIFQIIPAFVLSELKSGFEMGFAILLPFLVIDLVVANLLVGLGLSMVSPTLIAFPLKLLLFVTSEGWILVARGLVLSYV